MIILLIFRRHTQLYIKACNVLYYCYIGILIHIKIKGNSYFSRMALRSNFPVSITHTLYTNVSDVC